MSSLLQLKFSGDLNTNGKKNTGDTKRTSRNSINRKLNFARRKVNSVVKLMLK